MPVIKVWCLPWMVEGKLNELHRKIVASVVSVEELGLKNENDMTCLFPADLMKKGLGEEIIIEVTGLFEVPERTTGVRQQLAMRLANTVYVMFPKALVECFVYPFDPKDGYWTRSAPTPGSSLLMPKV